jgi:uncharacterized repeat protein (TIGR04138 family)
MDENPYQAPQTRSYNVSEPEREDWSDRAPRGLLHHEVDPTGIWFNNAAARSGLIVDGLRFVFDAMAWAPDLLSASPEAHTSGPELCVAIVRYAEEIFDAEGLGALRDWGLVSGEDVGRFVRALVHNGLMEASNDDRLEDFNGVGPLRQFPG